jgi:hypothetical protein
MAQSAPNFGDGNTAPDFLTAGASAALPQSGATGGPSGASPAVVQQLLAALSGHAQGMQGPTTTAQSQIPTPKIPQTPNIPGIQVGGADRSFATKGEAQRAKKQAFLNNIATIGNQIVNYENAKKTREMESLVTRIQGATEGKQQAEAMLKQDPNNADAKAQLKRNSDILSDIFSDPSNGKKIQKAFSVPLIGDKGKQTPEYQGLIAAIKSKDKDAQQKAGGAMADKFQQQFPSMQAPSPQTQMQMALVKAGVQPRAGQQLEAQAKMFTAISNYARNLDSVEARKQIADMYVKEKDKTLQNDYNRMLLSTLGKMGAAQIVAEAHVKGIGITAQASMQNTQWRMAGNLLNTLAKDKQNNKLIGALSTEYQRIQNELKNLAVDTDKLGWTDRKGINANSQKVKDLRDKQTQLLQRMGQLNLGGSDDNTGTGAGSGGQGSSDTDFDKHFEGLLNETGSDSENDPN